MSKTRQPVTLAILALAWTLTFAGSAGAQLIVGQEDETEFAYHVDVGTGTPTALFKPADNGITVGGVEGLAVDEANRTIYWSTGSGTSSSAVYSAHYDDYDLSFAGTLRVRKVVDILYQGSLQRVAGLAWDSTNNKLYAADPWQSTSYGPEGFYEIDMTTGVSTMVVDLSAVEYDYEFRGLDYNPSDGLFYATNADSTPYGTGLFSVDINNVLGGGAGAIALVVGYAGTNNHGLGVGNDRAYLVIDDPGVIGVYNLVTSLFEGSINAPWLGNTIDAGGGWGPGALDVPPGANLGAFVTATVEPDADLEVGVMIIYTITVANFGPSAATNVTVTSTLSGSAGADILSVNSSSGNAVENPPGSGIVTDTFASFPVDTTQNISLRVRTTGAGELIQTVSFPPGGEADGYLGNNTNSMTNHVRVFPPVETIFYTNLSSIGGSSDVPGLGGVKFKELAGGSSNAFYRPARSPDGRYVAFVGLTNQADSVNDVIVLGDNGSFSVAAQQGVTQVVPGEFLGSLILDQQVALNNSGHLAFANTTSASSAWNEIVAKWDGASWVIAAREDDIVPAFAAEGYNYESPMDAANLNGNGNVAFRLNDLGGAPSGEDEVLIGTDGNTVFAREGVDTPSGQAGGGTAAWENFDAYDRFWTDALGLDWLAQGDLTGSTTGDDVLVVNGEVVLQEGQGIPGVGGTIPEPEAFAGIVFSRMASNGDWFSRGTTSQSDQDWLVQGRGATFAVLAKHGDEIFGGAGEHWSDLEGWGRTFLSVASNNQGDYIICGRTDSLDTHANTVAVLNGTTVVLREGDPIDLDGNGSFDDDIWVRFFEESDAVLTDDGDFYVHVSYTDDSGTGTSGDLIGKAFLRLPVGVSPIPDEADLLVTKTGDPDLVLTVGGQATYTITVCNSGPQDATNVMLTDTLPAGIAFVSATPPLDETAPGSGVVIGNLGTIPSTQCVTVEIVGQAVAEGDFTNNVSVTADQADPDTANNSASAETAVENHADMAVAKTDRGGTPAGGTVTYDITITNNGPATATNVVMTDTIDPNTTFVSGTNGAQETFPGSGIIEATFASIAPMGGEAFEIVVLTSIEGTITNTAAVTAVETDVDANNNTATIQTEVSNEADVAIAKSDGDLLVIAGQKLKYTLTITNNGPATATNVVMTDTLPAGVNFVFATNGAAETAPGSGVVEATFAGIPVLGTEVVHIMVETTAAGTIDNQASVTANETDPNAGNNTAAVSTRVGNFRAMQVIFTEITGHPTAQVPGARDLSGLPIDTEFKALEDLHVSPDGSRWFIKGRNWAGGFLETMVLTGSGTVGDMLAQEGQPLQGGVGGELYDFFDSTAGFNDANDLAFGARARNGVSSQAEKVIKVIGGVHSIVVQQGDAAPGLTDNPPSASGDETFGNSLNSIHLLNDNRVGFIAAIIDNIHSSRRPAVYHDTTVFAQSGITPISPSVWDSFDSDDFRTTPDGAHWLAQGDDEGSTATDDILVVDGTVKLREGDVINPVTITAVFHTKLLPNGDWYSRGDDPANDDWAVRNAALLAKTGDPIMTGATETWGDIFLSVTGNTAGDWVLVGNTNEPDADYNTVLVLNGTEVVVREGDPVDLDGNGKLDDDVFIGRGGGGGSAFNTNDLHLTDELVLYFLAPLRDGAGNDLGTFGTGGDGFLRINLACPTLPGDLDGEFSINGLDLGAFVDCMLIPGPPAGQCPCADFDMDQDIDEDDINAAVELLLVQ